MEIPQFSTSCHLLILMDIFIVYLNLLYWQYVPMDPASLSCIIYQDNIPNKKKKLYSYKNKTLRKSKRSLKLRKYNLNLWFKQNLHVWSNFNLKILFSLFLLFYFEDYIYNISASFSPLRTFPCTPLCSPSSSWSFLPLLLHAYVYTYIIINSIIGKVKNLEKFALKKI